MGAAHGSGTPETPDPGAPFVVPDDASALEADRLAWLAEERRSRRRRRLRRLVFTRRWDRFGLSGPIVVICLMLTGFVGALAVVFVPRPSSPFPVAEPLAPAPVLTVPAADTLETMATSGTGTTTGTGSTTGTGTTTAPEVAGRLLPAVALEPDVEPTAGTGLDVRELRPALLLLLPRDCACTSAVHALYAQAREFQLTTWYLAASAPESRRDLARLDADASAGGGRWAVDPQDTVARTVAARGLTAVLVRGDGVVSSVVRNIPADAAHAPALELDLARLASRKP